MSGVRRRIPRGVGMLHALRDGPGALGPTLRRVSHHPGLMPLDEPMMRAALELAQEAARAGEAPIGAVIYETESGTLLAGARNTREAENDPTAHAEVLALREAAAVLGDWRLNRCTLVVTLEPCCMCAGAIVNARVGRVVYGADDPKAGACRSLYRLLEDPRLNHRVAPLRGVLKDESAALLRAFFRAKRSGRASEPIT